MIARKANIRLSMMVVVIHGIEAIINPIMLANRTTRIEISE